ncbi:putative acyl-protein thioesterase 1 [Triangularia verruculosa]|uniref:Acyl-protein thioesterase 1 n=1 Tax=Triangularia verruculosa TaxID=2587418 RepID=A0AAN6XIL1_9PEZI|nr:putative acyl-protein thioesterase 1 [Triangularia verruculosa]
MALQTTAFPPLKTPQYEYPHTHTLIFLHGRGDKVPSFLTGLSAWESSPAVPLHSTEPNPEPTALTLRTALPTFRLVFPQAPLRTVAAAAARGEKLEWNQWFDVWNTNDFSDREELQVEGLKESVSAIRELIRQEAQALGGRYDRIILAGISMGGATSIHTLFNLDRPIGAFMGFCCRCPFAESKETLGEMRAVLGLSDVPQGRQALNKTPILLQHCVDDPLVKIESGRNLREVLVNFGAQSVGWEEYETGGHWFKAPDGMNDVISFLREITKDQTDNPSEDFMMDDF